MPSCIYVNVINRIKKAKRKDIFELFPKLLHETDDIAGARESALRRTVTISSAPAPEPTPQS